MYDPFIMLELLSRPQAKKLTENLTPFEVERLKELLVRKGAYARYEQERESEAFRKGWIRGDEQID
jgi:hypothetical protein